ncbi:MAG: substrate-binding domain-containing protein [Chloroflexi bacterium]|nr:substrate-binding domain-containing protein [Chloroflexota bacterium]
MGLPRENAVTRLLVGLISAAALLLAAACAGPAATPVPAGSAPAPTSTSVSATPSPTPVPACGDLILGTTTSTQDSGLLDVLLPMFEQQSGCKVKPIAVGSGQAMALGQRGEADVLLVHAPDSEEKFMADGHGVDRRLVMHNDFVLIGPKDDPAHVKGSASASSALAGIAGAQRLFLSRGDNSGTDQLEKKLWKSAGITPKGQSWYQETGQGMGLTLNVATEKAAYTISDRATYLALKDKLALGVVFEGDPALYNVYHVIVVNPNKSSLINNVAAIAFAGFMVSPQTQKVISEFGLAKFGQPLFTPDATR